MPLYTNVITPEPRITRTQADRYKSTGWQVFSEGLKEGIQYSTIGAAAKKAQWYAAGNTDDAIDKDTWSNSEHFREGLEYEGITTTQQAQIAAERFDIARRREFVRGHVQNGVSATALSLIGGLIGAAADPINYVPVLGPASKLYAMGKVGTVAVRSGQGAVRAGRAALRAGKLASTEAEIALTAKLGHVGARTVRGGIEAFTGTTIQQPFVLSAERDAQEDYDILMALANIGIATTFGLTFGAVTGMLGNAKVKEHTAAMSKAMDDVGAGRAVDVAPIIKPEMDRLHIQDQVELESLKAANLVHEKELATLKTERAGYRPTRAAIPDEHLLARIANDLKKGYAGRRQPVKDEFGVIVDYEGIPSAYPEYFKNKGLKRKEVLGIIDKRNAGKKLTEKQELILEDMLDGARGDMENEFAIMARHAGEEARPNTVMADLNLEVGDEFKVYGETYRIESIDPEGKFVIEITDGEGTRSTMKRDPFDQIPRPDEESILRITPEARVRNARIAELESKLQNELRLDTGDEPFVPIDEKDLVDVELTEDVARLQEDIAILEKGDKIDAGERAELDAAIVAEKDTSILLNVYKAAKNCILRGE